MSKRKFGEGNDDGVRGYITQVSPIKLARNEKTRFFTAEMITSKTESRKVICFSPEKHQMFKTAESSPDAFILKKAKVQPGRDGHIEVKCFRETDIETCSASQKLDFTKDYKTFINTEEKSKVFNICDLKEDYQMGSINVKFLGFETKDKVVFTKYGERTVNIGILADTTDCRRLTIWSDELMKQLEAGKFFNITNIQNKIFNDEMNVNTTSSTKVVSIPQFEGIKEDLAFLEEIVLDNGEFISIALNSSKKCSVCKRNVDFSNTNTDLFKCPHCNFKQLVCNLESKITVTGYVRNETTSSRKVTIQENVLSTFLQKENLVSLLANDDALEDYILLNKPYKITFSGKGDIVSNLTKCQDSNAIQTI